MNGTLTIPHFSLPLSLSLFWGVNLINYHTTEFGPNEIPAPSTPTYMIFVRQFTGFLPILIEIAAIISLAVQDWTDFGIIVAILVINGT